jgi:hypothetical protein
MHHLVARVISHAQPFSRRVACPRAPCSIRTHAPLLAQPISDDAADRLAVITVIRQVAAHAAQFHRAPPDDGGIPRSIVASILDTMMPLLSVADRRARRDPLEELKSATSVVSIAFLIYAKAEHTWPFGPKEIKEAFAETTTRLRPFPSSNTTQPTGLAMSHSAEVLRGTLANGTRQPS